MEQNKPLVSVIIPCYNLGIYLDEAVESVLAQTYQHFEIIIVNDGSTDSFTNELLANYSKTKTTVFHTENRGVSAARNFGIAQSNGEYIVALDADDRLHAQFLEKTQPMLQKYDIVYTEIELFGGETGLLPLPVFSIQTQLMQNLINNTALYKKQWWTKTVGYNTNMRKGWEDWDFWLSILEKGATVYKIPEILFYYRVLPNSRNRSFSHDDRITLEQQLIANHIELYRQYFPEPLSMLRELDALRKEKAEFEKYKAQIYSSASYRLGNFLLKTVKWVKHLLK